MLIESIRCEGMLSLGKMPEPFALKNLNVLIGANGSGKSNFIEVLEFLSRLPKDDFQTFCLMHGGAADWFCKTRTSDHWEREAFLEVSLKSVHYNLRLCLFNTLMFLMEEEIKCAHSSLKKDFIYSYQTVENISIIRSENGIATKSDLKDIGIKNLSSIMAQENSPLSPNEIFPLVRPLSSISFYREWSFGRNTKPRQPQRADMPNVHLEPDGSNLGLVLSYLRREPATKKRLLSALQKLYQGIEDFDVLIEGNFVQVFFHENGVRIPATRLSDGTLRYLCLLAILCHPKPPPLICIEEPELGLHPDVLLTIADLLKEASERTQLIVTTHSSVIVDAMSDDPEAVVVVEKGEFGTELKRLNAEELAPWLEKYCLGEFWVSGEIGGNRW